jgi:hypothetical protein
MKRSPRQRICDLYRVAVLASGLLITLSGLAVKTYWTTMDTAAATTDIRADLKAYQADMIRLQRNDAAQDQRMNDGEKDRENIRRRLERLEDGGKRGGQ